MRLSVIIPTHSRPQGIDDLLRSISDQEFASNSYEVHVVANLDSDPGERIVGSYKAKIKNLHYHVAGRKGANVARNVGLDKAVGEILVLLDDDCVLPHRYYLREIYQAHLEHPNVTAIGGGYFPPPDANAVELAYNHGAVIWLKRRVEDGNKCVNLVGGNVSYKRADMLAKDLRFNDEIVFGGAETELHVRMYLAGCELLFLEHLRVEHRARFGPKGFLRKAFLQGMGAHLRWSRGIHVATRLPPETILPPLSPLAKFWKEMFDRSFRLGTDFARTKHRPQRKVTRVTRRNFSHLTKWALNHLAAYVYQKAKKQVHRWKFGYIERQNLVGLPLNRYYVLSIADRCRYECSYCPQLGCKNPSADLDQEIQRAKNYGFKEILLPCNAFFVEGVDRILNKIGDAGLSASVLVNGDAKAPIVFSQLQKFSMKANFHLLLGPASSYQKQLIKAIEKFDKNFTATYFHRGVLAGLAILKKAPPELATRLHFLFAAEGNIWHPRPSGIEIHKFLNRVRSRVRRRYSLLIRGPAGHWPVDRGDNNRRTVWPLLDERWSCGQATPQVEYSVIIPTFDSGPHLVKVLRSLKKQSIGHARFEVLIMDDGSRDSTLDLLKFEGPFPFHLRYFYWPRSSESTEPEFRAGLIRNLGVSKANGEFLCFLDSDILVPPNYLEDLGRRFEDNDVIQARRDMLSYDVSIDANGYREFSGDDVYPDDPYWETFKSFDCWAQVPGYWKYTCTYALSMRKDLFLKAGWFSPEFFSYGFEDVDLGYRFAKLGARFHLSQNTVFHLYPERREHNYHFDAEARSRALTLSSRVFFRNRLDPAIFNEFYPAYYQPIAGELRLWYVRTKIFVVRASQPMFKPYHFVSYQVQKRILRKVEHAEG